jgi:hypothetical protein
MPSKQLHELTARTTPALSDNIGTAAADGLSDMGRTTLTELKVALSLNNVPNIDATNPLNIDTDASNRFVTDVQIGNWNTAFGWGNHSGLYSLTSHNHDASYQALDADLTAIAALAGTSGLLRKTGANTWTLDTATYLTSYSETDPVFLAHAAANVTNIKISNWDTAFSWGDHGAEGYLTAETDPLALKITQNLADLNNAATARTNLGATTVGGNLFTLTNPSAVRFIRINADNTVTPRSAADMLTDLGAQAAGSYLVAGDIGVTVQGYDADLATWAGITPSANAQSLITAANYAAMRTLLDLEAGTDFYSIAGADAAFQPLDSDLTTIAGLTATTDNFIVSVASAWASRTPSQVKTTLALNNVENTALSTWAGTANITTLGTITTGTWSGTAIATAKGGVPAGGTTGQVLKKASNTDFDYAWDTDATGGGGVADGDKGDITVSASGATWTIDDTAVTYAKIQNISAGSRVLGRISGGAGGIEELTAQNIRTILGFTFVGEGLTILASPSAIAFIKINADNSISTRSASELRSDLGLVIGTNVQAWNAALDTWATKTAPSGTVVGTSDSQTLTNKRFTDRINDVAAGSSLTPTGDTADQCNLIPNNASTTINAPSGTPTSGQKLLLRLEASTGVTTLTWNATYRVIGVTLPATLVSGKITYVGCIWNALDTFWDVVAVTTEA